MAHFKLCSASGALSNRKPTKPSDAIGGTSPLKNSASAKFHAGDIRLPLLDPPTTDLSTPSITQDFTKMDGKQDAVGKKGEAHGGMAAKTSKNGDSSEQETSPPSSWSSQSPGSRAQQSRERQAQNAQNSNSALEQATQKQEQSRSTSIALSSAQRRTQGEDQSSKSSTGPSSGKLAGTRNQESERKKTTTNIPPERRYGIHGMPFRVTGPT